MFKYFGGGLKFEITKYTTVMYLKSKSEKIKKVCLEYSLLAL